jgi:hypothetical protein
MLFASSCVGSAAPDSPASDITPTTLAPTITPGTNSPAPEARLQPGQRLRFERISVEQGFSQSTVFCVLQDSQEYMWLGTEDGLNKYDGYSITITNTTGMTPTP